MTVTVAGVAVTEVATPLARPFVAGSVVVEAVNDVFVAVTGSDGAVGVGYGSAFSAQRSRLLASAVRSLAARVADRSVSAWALTADELRSVRRGDDVGVGALLEHALGVIELAMVDLAAVSAGVSVTRLLGGELAPVAFYLSGGPLDAGEQELGEFAAQAGALGAGTVKIKIDGTDPLQAEARTGSMLAVLPPGVRLAVDANQTFSPVGAQAYLEALAPAGTRIAWLEEPLYALDIDDLARLRVASGIPIAAGETLFGAHAVEAIVAGAAADLVILSVARLGGVEAFLRLGGDADARGLGVLSHVFPQVCAQLVAGRWPGALLEYLPWWDGYYEPGAYRIDGGLVQVAPWVVGFGFSDATRALATKEAT